jgi:hypothetical protein
MIAEIPEAPEDPVVVEISKYPRLLDVPDDQIEIIIGHIYEEVELQVGATLSDALTQDQLDQFEKIMDHLTSHPELAELVPNPATAWLTMNYPGYEEVVKMKISEIVSVLAENVDQIFGR